MAAVLVTLATAKGHLNIKTPALDPDDPDIQLKLDQAEDAILRFLKSRADPLWVSPATAPGNVTAAILIYMTWLFSPAGRGDAMEPARDPWPQIQYLLVAFRDPALA